MCVSHCEAWWRGCDEVNLLYFTLTLLTIYSQSKANLTSTATTALCIAVPFLLHLVGPSVVFQQQDIDPTPAASDRAASDDLISRGIMT